MNFYDPTVRHLSQIAMLGIGIVVIAPGVFACILAIDYLLVTKSANAAVVEAFWSLIPSPTSDDVKSAISLLAAVIAAIPAVLVAVTLRPGATERRLNALGIVLVLLFSTGAIVSFVGYFLINPEHMGPGSLGAEALGAVRAWALRSAESCVFYLAILVGAREVRTQ